MPATSRRVFIIVRAPNGDVREVPIGAGAVVIGRDESADIRVEDKKVSRRHASFKLIDGEPWVEDLGSANGVKLNGKRIERRAKIRPEDKVKVGGYQVTLKDLVEETGSDAADPRGPSVAARSPSEVISRDEVTPSRVSGVGSTAIRPKRGSSAPDDGQSPVLIALDEPVQGQRFVLHAGENIVGRLEECDVPVLDGSVSRQHARVVFARDRVSVSDLGSSNGTFVNDNRVEMAELADGDVLRIGNIRFELELPPELAKLAASAPVKAKARPKREGTSAGRPWAVAGMIVLLLAIAVLSFTIYWKWRARQAEALAGAALDAGPPALAQVEPSPEPTPGPPPEPPPVERTIERTIEPLVDAAPAGRAPDPDPPPREQGSAAPAEPTEPPPPQPPQPPQERVPADPVRPIEPPPAEPLAAPEPAGRAVAALAPLGTSTSPFGPRDARGVPLELPEVDVAFDFDAFVAEKLALAREIDATGDLAAVEAVVVELLARDPINLEARELWKRIIVNKDGTAAMLKAEKVLAQGDVAQALELYAAVPPTAPQAAAAKAKIEELKLRAVSEELAKAEADLESKKTWVRAHRRFRVVLEVDRENTRALEGIRAVERKMRKRNVRFSAYVPARAGEPAVTETPEDVDRALSRHFGGDEELAGIAQLYVTGQMAKAQRKAEGVERRAEGEKKDTARRLREALKTIASLSERVKNEISNDPNEAWAKLTDLTRTEDAILPPTVRSYLRRELETAVADAFANAGQSLFDRARMAEAFQRWEAGYKLDPTNPKLIAGFKRLEEHAQKIADEADLAAQRGEKKACERWKEITHITRVDSEVRRRALDRIRQACAG